MKPVLNEPAKPTRLPEAGASIWTRADFRFLAGVLLAVVCPWLILAIVYRDKITSSGLMASSLGTAAAFTTGFFVFSRLSRYPGIIASRYTAPTFLITYGIALAIFFFGRIDYNRAQFLISFAASVAWFLILHVKLRRLPNMRVGVVPFGQINSLLKISGVNWNILQVPDPEHCMNAIVADLRAELPAEWERYIADEAIRGNLVLHTKQLEESLTGKVTLEHLSENSFGSLVPGLVYGRVKRTIDVLMAVIAGLLLSPVLLVIAVLIKATTPGPVLFKQLRMGYRARPFTMYKFRSMISAGNSEDPRADAITLKADQRITRLGTFLRKYRLDELPQLVNIVKGEMSWIGPRPEAIPLSIWYEEELPFYRYRHIVRPGITGWAQVRQGHVSNVEQVHVKLNYDFFYIKNFSAWLDLLIALKTVHTVLFGVGSR